MFEAAVRVVQSGGRVQLDVMVPLVGTAAELKNQEQLVRRIANEVRSSRNSARRLTASMRGRWLTCWTSGQSLARCALLLPLSDGRHGSPPSSGRWL